jgi:alkaline phosphatase
MRKLFASTALVLLVFLLACNSGQATGKNAPEVRNIILLIGDGMGVTQVYSAMTVAGHPLNLEKFTFTGFSKTYSLTDYITDSAAGGTALATGHKTKNGIIAEDTLGNPLKTILEIAEEMGKGTGLVSTSAITHATPASFIAHEHSRNDYEAIAADFLDTDVDVFIGGGTDHFAKREDGRNLLDSLTARGYLVTGDLSEAETVTSGKLAALLAPEHLPPVLQGRGDMLPRSTTEAIRLLSPGQNGFFLMVEGSQIDWGGHANDMDYVTSETVDFDNAIGKALEFALNDGHTLVIVTADHETGGMALTGGSLESNRAESTFSTGGHTAVMVPVFAFGPGAEMFTGIYENTAIFDKMLKAFKGEI